MTIYTSTSQDEDFINKLNLRLGSKQPAFVWVDNSHKYYLHWKCCLLSISDERVTTDVTLSLGGYLLIVHKGSRFDGISCFRGGFTFIKEGFSYVGDELILDSKGVFHFQIYIQSTDDLQIGIQYFSLAYDENSLSYCPVSVRSPFITLGSEKQMNVLFTPLSSKLCSFSFGKEEILQTCLSTIYGEPISLKFASDFCFLFSPMISMTELTDYYAVPSGSAWVCTEGKFLLGVLSSEYVELAIGDKLQFVENKPAYMEQEEADVFLSTEPKTSYIIMENTRYYSQPQTALFYSKGEHYYQFSELPPISLKKQPLPILPFMNMNEMLPLAENIEERFLAVKRRNIVEEQLFEKKQYSNITKISTTRHGMKVCIENGAVKWLRAAFGNEDENNPGIAFTNPDTLFMGGFQSGDLFMVLTEEQQFGEHFGTPYYVSEENIQKAVNNGYPYINQLKKLKGNVYLSVDLFSAAIRTEGAVVNNQVLDSCDSFILEAAGWNFNLSIRYWDFYNTIFMIKLHTKKNMVEMMDSPELWSFPPSNVKIKEVQEHIRKMILREKELNNPVLTSILYDHNWQGTVIFNVGVDTNSLPDELTFLADNIPKELFKAMYLAFPFTTHTQELSGYKHISAFIDYNDTQHQYFEDLRNYAFKVLNLSVEIFNNVVVNFSAKAELLINSLFDARAAAMYGQWGNNLIFNGSYQSDENQNGRYSFLLDSEQVYAVSGSAVTSVKVKEAHLQTGKVINQFIFKGMLQMYFTGNVDIFSYESIPFDGLAIQMIKTDTAYEFVFIADTMRFGQDNIMKRVNSLAEKFPFVPVSIFCSKSQSPKEMGYTQLKVSGITQNQLEANWYGIHWEMKIGNLGGLASNAIAKIRLLTAWQTSNEKETTSVQDPKLFVGILLEGAGSPDDWALPLQGVMSLGFDNIELNMKAESTPTGEMVVTYFFLFKNFALTLLGMRFPNTSNDMYLVSNDGKTIGWYGKMEG